MNAALSDMGAGTYTSDAELVTDAQAGHAAAFEELVRRHATRVAYHIVGNNDRAGDIVQDAWVDHWRVVVPVPR